MGVFGENPRQSGRQRGPRSAGQYSLGKRMTLLAKYKVISSSGKSVYSIFLVNTILSLPVDSRRARRPCDRRIVLRFVRCTAPGPDRELVFGNAGGQKLRSALPAAIADMAGTDRRAAQVSAEISGCEIRHCVVTARHALFFTRIGSLISPASHLLGGETCAVKSILKDMGVGRQIFLLRVSYALQREQYVTGIK